MARPGLDAARRMLSAYAEEHEPWQPDHTAAMECRDLEDALGLGNAIFQAISEARRRHADQDIEEREAAEDLYRWWIKPCARRLSQIAKLEEQDFTVEGAADFRRNCQEAKSILRDMERAAAVEARVGLRDVTLSQEAADQLQRILDDPDRSAPRVAFEPRLVPLADPSVLLRR